jgi:DNA polymerase III delta prime subunit
MNRLMKQWEFKYAPQTIDDMVLQEKIKKQLKNACVELPSLLLTGKFGTGKSTAVRLILKETGVDYITVNGSKETSIENVRENISHFATSLGTTPIKFVFLNECDRLSLHAQDSLKQLVEDVYDFTRFLFATNHPEKVDGGLVSRAAIIDFNNPPPKEVFNLLTKILKKENIEYQDKTIVDLIKKLYPDIRNMINSMQLNCLNGKLEDINIIVDTDIYENIFMAMLEVDYDKIREYFRNHNIYTDGLYSFLFNQEKKFAKPGDMIIRIGEAYKWDSQVSNKEINFCAFFMDALRAGSIVNLKK